MTSNVKSQYYHWLCGIIGHEVNGETVGYNGKTYWLLLKDLHTKVFFYSVPNDGNRAFDGIALREEFNDETGLEYVGGPCTMLELIIGIARRCEFVMAGQDESIPTSDWFWKLIHNASLDRFTDDDYFAVGDGDKVDQLLDRIIYRTYHRNGQGGFFPLKWLRGTKKDQRKVELWYQMHAYLDENYITD